MSLILQVRIVDVNAFITAIVTIADDSKLRVWDPLKACHQHYVEESGRKVTNDDEDDDEACHEDKKVKAGDNVKSSYSANTNPEIVIDLKDEGNHTCIFSKGGR